MGSISTNSNREIIDDFVREICDKRLKTAKPSKTVINFRTDIRDGKERTIWRVPVSTNFDQQGFHDTVTFSVLRPHPPPQANP